MNLLGIALVAITHSPKGKGVRAINSFVGSIAFVGAARSGHLVTKDPDQDAGRLFLPAKQNVAPGDQKGLAFRIESCTVKAPNGEAIETSRVIWTGYADIKADDALAALEGPERGQLAEAEAFLRHALRDGPASANEIQDRAKDEGISERTLRRAKGALGVLSQKSGLQDGWNWQLPPHHLH